MRFLAFSLMMAPALASAQALPQFRVGPPTLPDHAVPRSYLDQAITGKLDTAETGIVPDTLRQASDGADDAPSIQRALTAACGVRAPNLLFRARHYALNSPVTQTCYANWLGRGWQEQNPSAAAAPGTWFDIGPGFINYSGTSIRITGNATGSVFSGIGFTEPGQPTAPVPVVNGSGQVMGWNPPSWTPQPYAPAMILDGVPGVTVKNVMFLGVNTGAVCVNSGRCNFENIRGQAFTYLLNIQNAFDVSRVRDLHQWPYWSQSDPVMQYQQANATAIISYRNDTPMWDGIFAFGVNAGVRISQDANGSTTGLAIGTLSCDFAFSCLMVDANVGSASFQIGNIRSYGQRWDNVSGNPVTMLSNSNVLYLTGATIGQISSMENFGSDLATVVFNNTNQSLVSNVHIDSAYIHAGRMSVNSSVVHFPPISGNVLTINQPMITPDAPSGFTLTNTNSGQAGVGTLFTGSYSASK